MNRYLVLTLAVVALVCSPAVAGVHVNVAPQTQYVAPPVPQYVAPQAYEAPCPCPPTVAYLQPAQQYLVAAPQPVCYTQQQTVCATPSVATVGVASGPVIVENRLTWRERRRAGKDFQRSLRGAGNNIAVSGGYAQQVAYAPNYYAPQAVGAYSEGAHAE